MVSVTRNHMKLYFTTQSVTLQLVLVVAVSMNNSQIFIVQKNICVMYYKFEMCSMLHSAVKFRQNIYICRK